MPIRCETLQPRSRAVIRRETDPHRRARHPWRALYKTSRWSAIRMCQLTIEPLCRMCSGEGRVEPATICDHEVPHRGDVERFFAGPFQSLCKLCHDSRKQRAERAADAAGTVCDGARRKS